LPWACALLVVAAIVARFAWRTEPPPAPKAEDRLPPPSEKAPAAEWAAYGQTLNDIRAGKDPILQSPEAKRVPRAELDARLAERRQAAEEAHRAHDERLKARMAQSKEETRRRLLESGINPDAPPPPPLVRPPQLGEPVVEQKR
jgi:hypothetical protein